MTAPPFGTSVPGNRWDLAPTGAPRRTVSVVVAHYEQQAELDRTLAALQRQTRPPDEVVVADDGSSRAPVVPDGVRLVRQDDDGFRLAAVRNLGVAASTGDVLVLLDADTTPEPSFVERMVALPEALPEALVVGRRRHADLAGTGEELPEPEWLRTAYADTRDLLDADATGHRFLIGAVVACTRWWYDEIGGFDETFRAYGGEDWELAHRSWTAGGLLAHCPDAVAWHDGPDAGGRDRDPDAQLTETVAIADRTSAAGTTWRGLLRGPADLVVTLAPTLDGHRGTGDPRLAAGGAAAGRRPARRGAPGAGRQRPADREGRGADPHDRTDPPRPSDAGCTATSGRGRSSSPPSTARSAPARWRTAEQRWRTCGCCGARPAGTAPISPQQASRSPQALRPWTDDVTLESWLGGWHRG